jgi:hypothetical protein
MSMRRGIIESPFRSSSGFPPLAWWQGSMNRVYARHAMLDCPLRGEAPLASHLLYP